MIWNSYLLKLYTDMGEKPFIRDFLIDGIIGGGTNYNFVSPYIINSGPIIVGIRAPNIEFRFTEEEEKKYSNIESDIKNIQEFISFIFYNSQIDMLDTVSKNRLSILNVSRQIGTTTIMALYVLHYAMFNKNKTTLVLCPTTALCKSFYEIIYSLYIPLPFFLKKGIANNRSPYKIVFDNGSQILLGIDPEKYIMTNIDTLVLSDLAHNSHQSEINSMLVPRLLSIRDGRIIIFSTPTESDKYFSDIYLNNNNFVSKEYPWYVIPNRDGAWKKDMMNNIHNTRSFAQEFECFLPNTKSFYRHINLNNLII